MKKYVAILALLATQQLALAQTVNVHFKNGQIIEYPSDNIDYVDFSAKLADPSIEAGQVVDLGLSVYWASCNLGAGKPEEYGNYYAWGETKSKSNYARENYSYYNNEAKQFVDIGDNICGTQYDAAYVSLGNNWRMPTKEELQELLDNCTSEWTQINNVNGMKITGKNGNSIFIPASGYYYNSLKLSEKDSFLIWSGSKSNYSEISSYSLGRKYGNMLGVFTDNIENGLCIRPVTTNPSAGNNN